MIAALGLAALSAVEKRGRMPDLSGYEEVGRAPMLCPTGVIVRVGYNEPGSNPGILEALAFYPSVAATRPFVVGLFETDVRSGLLKVYIDRDLDGKADASGMPGNPGIGTHLCDNLPRRTLL